MSSSYRKKSKNWKHLLVREEILLLRRENSPALESENLDVSPTDVIYLTDWVWTGHLIFPQAAWDQETEGTYVK